MLNTKNGKNIALATTACVIMLGLLFIFCCAHLFFTGGDQPYSRERVGSYLLILAIPSAITLALVVGGFVYAYLTGAEDDEKTPRTASEILEGFSKRYDIYSFDEDTLREILKERSNRIAFKIFSYFLSAVILVVIFVYMFLIAEFTVDNLNADVIAALTVVLPLSVIALGIHVPRVYIAEKSAGKELEIMKSYIKEHKPPRIKETNVVARNVDSILIAKCVLIAVAVVFVTLGILNGGINDVFTKAVNVCTECIGIG